MALDIFQRIETALLSNGDLLLLYTDGVTEVLNNGMEQFGHGRLADLLMQSADLGASDTLQTVLQRATAFGDFRSLADDVTMVALRISG